MRTAATLCLTACLLATAARGADAPAAKTLSDAEIYIKVRMADIEKEKAEAIAAARADAERRIALQYQATLADLKRQLIEERAKAVELEAKAEDLTRMLKSRQPEAPPPPTPQSWGKPLFEDDFSRADVSDKWDKESLEPRGNHFTVADGMLTGKETIATLQRFSGKAIRVEYDTWTIAENPCDASVYLADPKKDFSVFCGIGGNMNRVCRLIVSNKELAVKNMAALVRGKRQHMVFECGQSRMRIEVDGKTVLQYEGAEAPAQLDDVRVVLYTWTAGMHFGNVKVYAVP